MTSSRLGLIAGWMWIDIPLPSPHTCNTNVLSGPLPSVALEPGKALKEPFYGNMPSTTKSMHMLNVFPVLYQWPMIYLPVALE